MSMSDNGGSAFPACNEANVNGTMGMSLRDYFAARFMAAMALHTFEVAREQAASPHEAGDTLAMISYKMADAMLAERAKDGET